MNAKIERYRFLQRIINLKWVFFPLNKLIKSKKSDGQEALKCPCGRCRKKAKERNDPEIPFANAGKCPQGQWGEITKTIPFNAARKFHGVGINVGLSNLVVLDIDPRNGGDVTAAALFERVGGKPLTFTVRTGGGGRHYYFQANPEWIDPIKGFMHAGIAKTKIDLGPGVEIFAGRHFIVAPYSMHRSGNLYVVDRDAAIGPFTLPAIK